MAAKEMYDYFTGTVTPDYNATLSIKPQGEVKEETPSNQTIHYGTDGSTEVITHGSTRIYYLYIEEKLLSESDSGTIFDWWNDDSKAKKCARSFKYAYGDGHTYTVKFEMPSLSRQGNAMTRLAVPGIKMRVLGVAP